MDIRVMVLRSGLLQIDYMRLCDCYKNDFNAIEIRTDPKDFQEHSANCRTEKPDVVVLPKEKPIPAEAMANGVPHITFTPNGPMLLKEIVAVLVPFDPAKPGCIGEGEETRIVFAYKSKSTPYTPED